MLVGWGRRAAIKERRQIASRKHRRTKQAWEAADEVAIKCTKYLVEKINAGNLVQLKMGQASVR